MALRQGLARSHRATIQRSPWPAAGGAAPFSKGPELSNRAGGPTIPKRLLDPASSEGAGRCGPDACRGSPGDSAIAERAEALWPRMDSASLHEKRKLLYDRYRRRTVGPWKSIRPLPICWHRKARLASFTRVRITGAPIARVSRWPACESIARPVLLSWSAPMLRVTGCHHPDESYQASFSS